MSLWTVKRSQLCRGTVLGDESDLFSKIFLIKVFEDIKWSKTKEEQSCREDQRLSIEG